MIAGIGIDIIEVKRIAEVLERHGDRFLKRIYTPLEIETVHGTREQYLAARFAAKEAMFKALGTGWSKGVRWVDVEVENLPSGQPVIRVFGKALKRATKLGVERYHISISHTADYAAAQVILEAKDGTIGISGLSKEDEENLATN